MLVKDSNMTFSHHFTFLLSLFIFCSGCNPNIQTTETEVLKTQASARKMEFEQKCKESRHRIIMLEKSKAMKRVKELKEIQEREEAAAANASNSQVRDSLNLSSLKCHVKSSMF